MPQPPAILVVDDNPDIHQAIALALLPWAGRVDRRDLPESLAEDLANQRYDCLLLDMNYALGARSGGEGLSALDIVTRADPTLSVVLMTAYGGMSLAIDGFKRGACDFLLKPWRNEALVATVREAVEKSRARRSGTTLDELERQAIGEALDRCSGNIAQAAVALGLSRPALYRRMVKHGL